MNAQWSQKKDFKFSAGPWNLHPGADPFGPTVRGERSFVEKLKVFQDLGFEYVQFHDDDAVPDDYSASDREKKAKEIKKLLDDHGLKAEIAAPRLWEDARGIDGPVTSNDAGNRKWAIERGKRNIDVARILQTDRFVWWPAREGTFGSVDLRRAFNQVDVLVRHGYGKDGGVVGLDVKAMRTQPAEISHLHLKHSKEVFLMLVDLAHSIDRKQWQGYVDARDYEGLELFILKNLMGR
jgi:hypothetical protein